MINRFKPIFQTAVSLLSLYVLFILLTISTKVALLMSSDLQLNTDYADLITLAAARHGIDEVLLAAVVQVESSFDETAVSSAGAVGLGGLMPVVYRDHCGGIDPFDPRQNLDCSAEYLAWLLEQLGDETLVIAAYHGGIGRVGACSCIPRQIDRVYVARVRQAKTAVVTRTAHKSLPAALYGGAGYQKTQGWHGSGAVAGYDFRSLAGCGAALYAPIDGVISRIGVEPVEVNGRLLVNTILVVENGSESVVLYHGDYIGQVGQQVRRGYTRIGTEASHGWSTGCHTHLSYRVNGVARSYVN